MTITQEEWWRTCQGRIRELAHDVEQVNETRFIGIRDKDILFFMDAADEPDTEQQPTKEQHD